MSSSSSSGSSGDGGVHTPGSTAQSLARSSGDGAASSLSSSSSSAIGWDKDADGDFALLEAPAEQVSQATRHGPSAGHQSLDDDDEDVKPATSDERSMSSW